MATRALARPSPAALALATALAALAPAAARADAIDPGRAPAAEDAAPKKLRERARKAPFRGPRPRAPKRPARVLNVYNSWTKEWLAVDPAAPAASVPAATRDRFLRDHYTNEPTSTDPALLDLVGAAARHFDRDVAIVVSAFRHPKYNLMLRKKGHQVARDSSHTKANAIDFYLPGVPTEALHGWARDQRKGGVGRYLESGFVHMDTGRIRYWDGE